MADITMTTQDYAESAAASAQAAASSVTAGLQAMSCFPVKSTVSTDYDATHGTSYAKARYLKDRFSDVCTVKDFGAKGDGTTDDTAAFAAAYDARHGAFIPAGSYVLSRDLPGIFTAQSSSDVTITGGYVAIAYMDDHARTNESVTITVGTGGDFTSLSAAIVYAQRHYAPTFRLSPVRVTISIIPGYVITEQIVADGVDLSFITVSCTARPTIADVIADDYAMSSETGIEVNPAGFSIAMEGSPTLFPMFYACNGGRSPRIAAMFYVPSTYDYEASGAVHIAGFAATTGGHVTMEPESGIVRSYVGVAAYWGGEVTCYVNKLATTEVVGQGSSNAENRYGVLLDSASRWAAVAQHGGKLVLPRTIGRHAWSGRGSALTETINNTAVYVIWNSMADLYQSNFSDSGGRGVLCRDGSVACCRETTVSGAKGKAGFHTIHGAMMDARFQLSSWSQQWPKPGAQGCARYAVLASNGTYIDCCQLLCNDAGGNASISVTGASNVQAAGVNVSGSKRGLWAAAGANVAADNIVATNCPWQAIKASSGARIMCTGATITSTGESRTGRGIYCEGGASVTAIDATITGCVRGIQIQSQGTVNCDGATISGSEERCASNFNGVLSLKGASLSATSGVAVSVHNASTTHLQGATFAISGTASGLVLNGYGNMVYAGSVSGIDLPQAVNAISERGIIWSGNISGVEGQDTSGDQEETDNGN